MKCYLNKLIVQLNIPFNTSNEINVLSIYKYKLMKRNITFTELSTVHEETVNFVGALHVYV